MAVLPYGTPIRYRDGSGNIYAGLVFSDNGVNPDLVYYNGSGWVATGAISTRDDTGATNNSYAVVSLTTSFQGT